MDLKSLKFSRIHNTLINDKSPDDMIYLQLLQLFQSILKL